MKHETKEERSLLLFLEDRAVNNSGLVDAQHMNAEDMEIAEGWHESGYVLFGRIKSGDWRSGVRSRHWCHLSDEAHADAGALRTARARRSEDANVSEYIAAREALPKS